LPRPNIANGRYWSCTESGNNVGGVQILVVAFAPTLASAATIALRLGGVQPIQPDEGLLYFLTTKDDRDGIPLLALGDPYPIEFGGEITTAKDAHV
jgi:hypothetical protein